MFDRSFAIFAQRMMSIKLVTIFPINVNREKLNKNLYLEIAFKNKRNYNRFLNKHALLCSNFILDNFSICIYSNLAVKTNRRDKKKFYRFYTIFKDR